jgi:hypothetical protein
MRRTASLLLTTYLAGCAAPGGYVEYTQAVTAQSLAYAEVQAKTNAAILAMANAGDATTKTVAVMLLAMQSNRVQTLPVEPPRDQVLQWAAVIMPSVTALAGGYFGYRLGVTQSNNQAATTQSSYSTLGQVATGGYTSNALIAGAGFGTLAEFKPSAPDWASVIGSLQPNVNTTNTTNTSITNSAGGDAVMGAGTIRKPTTTTTDNSTRTTTTNPAP